MKRDMDLCRRILLTVENNPPDKAVRRFRFDREYPSDTVSQHVVLLNEAGLLNANITETFDGTYYTVERLTWDGHNFLDAARDDGRWASAKQRLEGAGVNATFTLLKETLEDLARKTLGLSG